MKRSLLAVIVVVVVVAMAALLIGLRGSAPVADNCRSAPVGKHLNIVIRTSRASATKTYGRLCDTLTFTNEDSVTREIAFGPHEHHVPYDGIAQQLLAKGQSLTITLNKPGTYYWHDHLHDEIAGTFVVAR